MVSFNIAIYLVANIFIQFTIIDGQIAARPTTVIRIQSNFDRQLLAIVPKASLNSKVVATKIDFQQSGQQMENLLENDPLEDDPLEDDSFEGRTEETDEPSPTEEPSTPLVSPTTSIAPTTGKPPIPGFEPVLPVGGGQTRRNITVYWKVNWANALRRDTGTVIISSDSSVREGRYLGLSGDTVAVMELGSIPMNNNTFLWNFISVFDATARVYRYKIVNKSNSNCLKKVSNQRRPFLVVKCQNNNNPEFLFNILA